MEAVQLELQMIDRTEWVPGETLTGVGKQYRAQWLTALHIVLQSVRIRTWSRNQ